MKRFIILIILIPGTWVTADLPMEKTEILQLFERLCQQPATGWVEQGRIEAIHHSLDVSGEVTETREAVTTDGERFVWETHIVAHNNGASIQAQDEFLQWNRDRIFIWDGQAYTLYFRPGNHAIVYEMPSSIPIQVTGPLTAGFIPWGQGVFAYDQLSQSQFSGVQVQEKDGLQIRLIVQPAHRPKMQLVIDPEKDTVISYTLIQSDDAKVVQRYGNFTLCQGRWIPMDILIDRYENNQLRSSDSWGIISVENYLPDEEMFIVPFKEKALVEYHSSLLEKPVFYHHSNSRSIEPLLEKRFITALSDNKHNCGTVAIDHVVSKFAMTATSTELAPLVDAVTGKTSLHAIKRFVEQKGLWSLAVKSDINSLVQYRNSQIILYLPKKQHFVVLDRIDKNNVWLIDLDRQTFYHCMDRGRLEQEWSGIALIVSQKPLLLYGKDVPVPDKMQKSITGSADYSCSEMIQEYGVEICPAMINGSCGGRYTEWQERYACQPDSSGGYCTGTGIIGSLYSRCIIDPENLDQCKSDGDFKIQNIRACLP